MKGAHRTGVLWWVALWGAWSLSAAHAQGPAEFSGADLTLGEQLLRTSRCAECHIRRVGGDGSAIYRPQGRIQSAASLITMVQRCSNELNLSLFPEEVTAIAAVLHRDHYRFK